VKSFPAEETLGIGPFEKPGGRPPVLANGLLHGPQRAQLGIQLGATEVVFELRIAFQLSPDRIVGAADEMRRITQAATAGDHGSDLVALGLIERAWPAGSGLL
jgi:hypothetical protein